MSDPIKVDFGAVQEASGQIDGLSKKIDQELDDLHRQIANLEQIWQGSSSEGFQQQKHQWESSAHDLQQTLARIGAAVGVAHENYLQTESKNSNRWG
ncbi:MAG: WXG100 family type VII secretion target [Nocardioidaceae bacterium]